MIAVPKIGSFFVTIISDEVISMNNVLGLVIACDAFVDTQWQHCAVHTSINLELLFFSILESESYHCFLGRYVTDIEDLSN